MSSTTFPGGAGLTATLWTLLRRAAVGCARLLGWFAAEPYRIRVALAAIAVCAVAGATLGAAVGYVTAWAADGVLGIIRADL